MTTTSLFVELIAVGIMATGWLLLLVAAFEQTKALDILNKLSETTILWIPALILCYVLGIVLDVLIDRLIYHRFEYRIRATQIAVVLGVSDKDKKNRKLIKKRIRVIWHHVRTFLWQIKTDETAREITTYFRHRIRVVRAASANSFLLGLAGYIYLTRQGSGIKAGLISLGLGIIFALACVYSWDRMSRAYNRSLFRYYLKHEENPISLDQILSS